MKKFMEEFKKFALKGNVMDMAVGVIIGGAFGTIVTALTENIINPLIGVAFKTDFSEVAITIAPNVSLGIGAFISAVINFILLALVLFVMVKGVNKALNANKKPEAPKAPVKSDELKTLEEILSVLKEQGK